MKKLNNKGFTLIEMVIVIVIIAILAAMLVPALLSYVNNANEKSFLNACDTIKTSTLTSMTNEYAKGSSFKPNTTEVADLVGGGATVTYVSTITKTSAKSSYNVKYTLSGNELSSMIIENSNYKGTFSSGNWTVTAAA